MPTGPASSSYIIPPLTLSDTMYEWYSLTNNEIIDKLNRLKVYEVAGDTGIAVNLGDDGVATVYIDTVIPGDHTFTGDITFNGTVTTVNTNLVTIDDYNLVLGAVGSNGGTGGTADTVITNAGGGGIVIAGACGDKYFLWKAFEGGRTYSAWRISDAIAFTGDAKFYSHNNKFVFAEGSDNTPASKVTMTTHSSGNTVDVETYFDGLGTTQGNFAFLNDGSTRVINGSTIKRFAMPAGGITGIGLTFGMVVRHDITTGGVTLARANTTSNAESIGIAVNLNTTSNFVDVNLLGYVSGNFANAIASIDNTTSLGTGEFYFLSESENGKITKTAPTLTGYIRKPILYALGSTQAMVMNYVGNKIVDTDSLYSKLNASTVVIKHEPNLFAIGDTVRFEEGSTAADRPFGSYVKANSNSTEYAEALGIVSKINYGGNSAASLMTVSGYIDLGASGLTFEPGQVYFLSGDDGKMTVTPPNTVGTVRKPIMIAVTPTAGIVQNYVGLVVNTNTDTGTSILIPQSGSGFRNKLINGNFDFWQRGTTFAFRNPVSEPNRYTADRWKLVNTGGSTAERLNVEVRRHPIGLGELDGSNVYSSYALRFAIGTGGYTSGSETYLFQRIEGIEHFSNGYATISFYARSSVTNSKLGVAFRRDYGGGTAPDYSTTGVEPNSQKDSGFVLSVPTSWTRYAYTFQLPESADGLLGVSGTDGPEIKFYIRAGTDLVGEDITEAINPNLSGVNDYSIYIAQVQFESGQSATPFELNDPTSEFNRCLRYYQTSNSDSPYRDIIDGNANATNDDSIVVEGSVIAVRYPVEIRDPDNCTVNTKTNPTTTISATTKSKKGFKATKPVGTVNLNYEVESEL